MPLLESQSLKVLNRNQLKYIAILAMVCDHVAHTFVPESSVWYMIMRFIGRITGPVMAYMIAEGYAHTHDLKRYILRLGIFSIISWYPYCMFAVGRFPEWKFSVITTLLLGLICICVYESKELSLNIDENRHPNFDLAIKSIIITWICVLSWLCDWSFCVVLMVLFAHVFRGQPQKQLISYLFCAFAHIQVHRILSGKFYWYNLGIIIPIILIFFFYNGQSGSKHPFHKWFFYIFYPLHLYIIYLISKFCVI